MNDFFFKCATLILCSYFAISNLHLQGLKYKKPQISNLTAEDKIKVKTNGTEGSNVEHK